MRVEDEQAAIIRHILVALEVGEVRLLGHEWHVAVHEPISLRCEVALLGPLIKLADVRQAVNFLPREQAVWIHAPLRVVPSFSEVLLELRTADQIRLAIINNYAAKLLERILLDL